MEILYKELKEQDLYREILSDFNRYQEVLNDWCPVSAGEYVLKSQPHIEDWDEQTKIKKAASFYDLLQRGGKIFGAFHENRLIGFSAINGELLGEENLYLELAEFHVSYEYRGYHIGRALFDLCVNAAKHYGCKKLYIVASSSEESQKVYRKLGCVHVKEYIPSLYEKSPADVHLEYLL